MKKCVYCGREYPEDVTVCSVDQQSVTHDGRPVLLPKNVGIRKLSNEEVRAYLALRPTAVKFAVGLLAFPVLVDTVRLTVFTYLHPSRDSEFYISALWTFAASLLVLYLVFRGKNWARWLTLCMIVLGTILPFPLHYHRDLIFYFYAVVDFLAAFLLFQPAPNEWFRMAKRLRKEPAPAM